MRRLEAILAVALAMSMTGCALLGKPKTTAVAVPPQPQPVAQPKPASPPEPLSIPQTQIQLPPPQALNQEALDAGKPPQPAEPATAPKPARRTVAAPPQAKPEVVAPAPAQTVEPELPPIGELVPPDETKRYKDSLASAKKQIKQLLEQARKQHRFTTEQTKTVRRINSFLAQSDEAANRGDMRTAEALAERGLVLASGLAEGQ